MNQFLSIGECMVELSGAEADLWKMGVAGDTLNTAWYARRLLDEAWEVCYYTRLGQDQFSDDIVDFLREAGINIQHIIRDPARGVGLYAIALKDGERSFTYWRGQSAARHLADDDAHLGAAMMQASVIFVSGITLAILTPDRRSVLIALMARAREAGKVVVFDPNVRPKLWENPQTSRDAITAAAAASSHVLPSFDDEAALFGDLSPEATLARYMALDIPEIIVKNGGGDIHYLSEGARGVLAGLPVVTPVDTTGAGDSFNAGFLAARLGGAAIKTALHAGHDLASKVVQAKGALLPPQAKSIEVTHV